MMKVEVKVKVEQISHELKLEVSFSKKLANSRVNILM